MEKSPFHKYFFFKNLRENWGRCNAGLIFRVNDAGPGYDRIRGYYVGFDARKLYLGKIENNWQPLAEFDLVRLDCKVLPDVWNQIRVAAEGSRIRVWLNRMHPSADSDRGLRIDFTDKNNPILSGAIGVRAHMIEAWFDNVAPLPVDVLPQSRVGEEDSRWKNRPYAKKQSAQVLRLDSADARWQVDLDMGKSNGNGLRYMKGNILKSITFTRDGRGN